jgi:hypothetical protein
MGARQVQRIEPRQEGLGSTASDAEPGGSRDRAGQRDRPRPCLHQLLAYVELRLYRVLLRGSSMRQTVNPALARSRQGGDIASVRLHPPASLTIHRRVIGIGDDDLMTKRLEVLRDPCTFCRSFEQNAHPRSAPERRGESVSRRRNATVKDLTHSCHDPNLTFLLV